MALMAALQVIALHTYGGRGSRALAIVPAADQKLVTVTLISRSNWPTVIRRWIGVSKVRISTSGIACTRLQVFSSGPGGLTGP